MLNGQNSIRLPVHCQRFAGLESPSWAGSVPKSVFSFEFAVEPIRNGHTSKETKKTAVDF
jgi:hypothetical protein